jgi:hypothetical protein
MRYILILVDIVIEVSFVVATILLWGQYNKRLRNCELFVAVNGLKSANCKQKML